MDKKSTQIFEDIRKLLILQLLANGVSDKAIAKMLDVDASSVRHLISLKEIRASKKNG